MRPWTVAKQPLPRRIMCCCLRDTAALFRDGMCKSRHGGSSRCVCQGGGKCFFVGWNLYPGREGAAINKTGLGGCQYKLIFISVIMPWSLPSKADFFSEGTDLGHLEVHCNSRRPPGATWQLAALPIGKNVHVLFDGTFVNVWISLEWFPI